MYDTPKSELSHNGTSEKTDIRYKAVKWLNLALMGSLISAGLINNFILSNSGSISGTTAFAMIALLVFFIPNLLVIRALPPIERYKKLAISTTALFSLFIIVGMISVQQTNLVIAFCLLLLAVHLINMAFLLLSRIGSNNISQ